MVQPWVFTQLRTGKAGVCFLFLPPSCPHILGQAFSSDTVPRVFQPPVLAAWMTGRSPSIHLKYIPHSHPQSPLVVWLGQGQAASAPPPPHTHLASPLYLLGQILSIRLLWIGLLWGHTGPCSGQKCLRASGSVGRDSWRGWAETAHLISPCQGSSSNLSQGLQAPGPCHLSENLDLDDWYFSFQLYPLE